MALPQLALLLLLLLLGSSGAVASAEPSPSQTFAVDLGATSSTPFDNAAVTRCFGSSHASTAMRADWQRELTAVQKDLGVEYVRFHGLLDDDMSVVVPGHLRSELPDLAAAPQKCTFVEDQDFRDPGANVVNASSKEQCCALCYTEPTGLPLPCVAAVFTPADGRCYFKTGDEKPYLKPASGVVACVTDRPSPAGPKNYQYSWSNIFTVFDFLQSINMRPIIEVSFMPELLAEYTNRTVFHYKGILSPPKHFADWRDFMTAFGTALTERYGEKEVAQWYFEVWNEPNCCGGYPDTGCCGPGCGNQSMYVDLFANTFKGLKAANPQLRVGGPATAQLAWIETFIAAAAGAGAPPDFVSSHLYPTDPWANEVALSHTRDGFFNAISDAADRVAAMAKQHGMPSTTQFLLTEFNCGLGQDCADSFYSSSFIAYHALNSQGIVDRVPVQSYWTFSDIFEESGQQPAEFSQAFGTRSFNGVPKPVYRAMQLIKRLGPEALPVTQLACSSHHSNSPFNCSANLTVTSAPGGGGYEALLVNHPMGVVSMRTNPPSLPPVTVTVVFKSAGTSDKEMPTRVSVRRVDATHANALPAYEAMGRPQYPNASAIAALKEASALVVEVLTPSPAGPGKWSVTLEMPVFSVASLSF